jgi:hypothetical protein
VSKKTDFADTERLEFLRRAVQPVFAKGLTAAEFQIRAETAPNALDVELRRASWLR